MTTSSPRLACVLIAILMRAPVLAHAQPAAAPVPAPAPAPTLEPEPPGWDWSYDVLGGAHWDVSPRTREVPPRGTAMSAMVGVEHFADRLRGIGIGVEAVVGLGERAHDDAINHVDLATSVKGRLSHRVVVSGGLVATHWPHRGGCGEGVTGGGFVGTGTIDLWPGEGVMTRVLMRAETVSYTAGDGYFQSRVRIYRLLVGIGGRWD